MLRTFKFEKSFGSGGSFAGMVVFFVGVAASFVDFAGLILVVLGAFVGFTQGETQVDIIRRRVRYSNTVFGLFKNGKWIKIQPSMEISYQPNKGSNRIFSRSNRMLKISRQGEKIVLLNANKNIIVPLCLVKTEEERHKMLQYFKNKLFPDTQEIQENALI